ncbi:MAG: polysaccharide biosynthesis C-terminal domain-containing protein [Methanocorpusculum sp.]|nr:polysaccharide biosynthesis C-terminal domain-containing protein [Oscillospiraceae bacterium]MBQ3569701.1 polysaccharide biosynthesis C-terminal domain-containing protein [Methanocorpusculum sp.]
MKIPFFSRIMSLSAIQRQSTLSLFFTVLITLIGFFSTMLFSHILGKDLMGVYYLFVAYYGIFNMIGDGGFGQAAVKRISEGKEQNEYLTAYACLRGLLIVVSTVILLTLSPLFIDLQEYNIVLCIILTIAAAAFGNTITMGVYGLGHVGVKNVGVGIGELSRIIVQIGTVLLGYSVYGLIGGYIAGIIVSGILCLKYFTFRPAKFGFRHIKSLFAYGFWIFLISTGSLAFSYTDTIFIGYFMTNGDVGVYRTAFQFTSAAAFITAAIAPTLTPKISRWSKDNEWEKIVYPVSRGITFGLILAVPVLFGGIFLADKLLYYFYGADFAAGAAACCILFAVQIVSVFTTFLGTALSASDHAKQSFYATATAAVVNIILNCILIPILGINGAAISTLISYSLNAVLIVYFLRLYISIRIEIRPIFHIIISAAVMGIFVFIYTLFVPLDNVILTLIPVAVGAFIYFFLLFKIDRGIRDEIAGMVKTFGIPWPKWL